MRGVWAVAIAVTVSTMAVAAPRSRDHETVREQPVWLGEELPLPLSVRNPDDLHFKAEAERQYLLFNLLAGGKLAWDKNDFSAAASKWERLLQLEGLPPTVDALVRPMAQDARKRAGGVPVADAPPRPDEPTAGTSAQGATGTHPPAVPPRPRRTLTTVSGTVTGLSGGSSGAVVWLKRADGPTPAPHPAMNKFMLQREKRFVPKLLAVPVGTTVRFRNDDPIFHNVFSLSRPNDFDLGLYKAGLERTQKFTEPGAVNLLCNIHAAMNAFIYVVDSPYYTQTDHRGTFTLRNVPPGDYVAFSWQETSAQPTQQPLAVKGETVSTTLSVSSDKPISPFPPDKAGKPRQPQLGY